MSELTVAELEALGVYDPAAPHAEQQLQLLQYLLSLGASAEDLADFREAGLAGLASVLTLRGEGEHRLTVSQAAELAGISEANLLEVIRAAGFPEPGPQDRVVSEQVARFAAGMGAVEALFDEEAVLQLVRVMGSAMSRLADALVSAYLVHVEPGVREEDPVGLAVARANAQATSLLPTVTAGMDILLRHHIIRARRTFLGDAVESGFETQHMCVGFVDLVGSTGLAQQLSTRELGAVLTEFEHVAVDSVTAVGGRVVKLIGDEILYTAGQESEACRIALDLVAAFCEHPRVPPVRAGVACGDVLLRDGDVFGPVVNLAARAVKVAGPDEVVTPASLAAAAGLPADRLTGHELKGFDSDIELCRLRSPS